MTKKEIEREKLRMFDTGSRKRNPARWVELIEKERALKRRERPRKAKKPRR